MRVDGVKLTDMPYSPYCHQFNIDLHMLVSVAVLAIKFWGGLVPPNMARAGARVYMGVWELCPQWGLGAKPLVRGSGGRSPPKPSIF